MLSAFVLVAFIKLLFVTDSPNFLAGLYTVVVGIGAVVAMATGGTSIPIALLGTALAGAIAFAYFWSLLCLPPWTGTWWAVVVVGALVMAIIP